jgi:hypothetical protein
MLNLHLMQQHIPILRQLDLAGAPHEHFESAAGSEVGFENVLKAGRGGDVHG